MISHAQCAQLSADIYDDAAPFDKRWNVDDVVCGMRMIGDECVIAFRGSVTAEDWLDDLAVVPVYDREVGFVHAGFLGGMDDVLAEVSKAASGPITVTGHSLGGARARIAAAKLLVRKQPVSAVVVFGSPKPGFANVGRVLEKGGAVHTSYRNRNDPVPLLPFTIEPLMPWRHTESWTAISGGVPDANDLDALRDHSIKLYQLALQQEAA